MSIVQCSKIYTLNVASLVNTVTRFSSCSRFCFRVRFCEKNSFISIHSVSGRPPHHTYVLESLDCILLEEKVNALSLLNRSNESYGQTNIVYSFPATVKPLLILMLLQSTVLYSTARADGQVVSP